ncbi:MAG: hypothetical protein IPN76_14840 [Saprospiraceae bacterium]|nr:hypothetical protein [Saprospiraceae bacterium]
MFTYVNHVEKDYSKTKPVCKVTFTLPIEAAQGGSEVRILGDFNDWSWENGYKMKSGKAEFTSEVELTAGKEYQFRYLIDNHIWENDWNADNYLPTPFGVYNSVISLREVAAAAAAKAVATKPAATKAEAKPTAPKAEAKTAAKKAVAKVATPKAEAKPAVAKVAAPKAEAKPAVAKAAAPAAKAAPKAAAAKPVAAKAVVADDLTKIEGIGPKIAELLKAAGIVTFKDLTAAKAATVKSILDAAGKRFQMHDPSTWAEQSKLAANGEWEKLAKLQDALKGGKK